MEEVVARLAPLDFVGRMVGVKDSHYVLLPIDKHTKFCLPLPMWGRGVWEWSPFRLSWLVGCMEKWLAGCVPLSNLTTNARYIGLPLILNTWVHFQLVYTRVERGLAAHGQAVHTSSCWPAIVESKRIMFPCLPLSFSTKSCLCKWARRLNEWCSRPYAGWKCRSAINTSWVIHFSRPDLCAAQTVFSRFLELSFLLQ